MCSEILRLKSRNCKCLRLLSGSYPYICGRIMIASLFKTRKPKRFEMRTRYYDAEKESFEARVNQSKNANDVSLRMKLQFSERRRRKVNASRQSSIRIVVIAAMLLLMAWYIFL